MGKGEREQRRNMRTQRALRIMRGLAGRYRAVVLGVIVLFAVLFGSDVVRIISLSRDISRLRSRKAYYEESIRRDSTVLSNLQDNEFLERMARERYLMRKSGEQIYIVKRQR